jgi:hypothetical protein
LKYNNEYITAVSFLLLISSKSQLVIVANEIYEQQKNGTQVPHQVTDVMTMFLILPITILAITRKKALCIMCGLWPTDITCPE